MGTSILLTIGVLMLSVYITGFLYDPLQTIINCKPVQGDKIIFKRFVRAGGTPFIHKSTNVHYPEKGNGSEIHCMRVIDLLSETSSGSKITIKDGGVGFTFVTIYIKSKLGKGYNVLIELYG